MARLREIENGEDPFENLSSTRPSTCPVHTNIKEFVRVPKTNIYVCPIPDHSEAKRHNVDRFPGGGWHDR